MIYLQLIGAAVGGGLIGGGAVAWYFWPVIKALSVKPVLPSDASYNAAGDAIAHNPAIEKGPPGGVERRKRSRPFAVPMAKGLASKEND